MEGWIDREAIVGTLGPLGKKTLGPKAIACLDCPVPTPLEGWMNQLMDGSMDGWMDI